MMKLIIGSRVTSYHASSAESGRSMIEMLGVLAIGAVLAVGAFKTYSVLRERQIRMVAIEDMREIAKNAKILFGHHKDYMGISKSYLVNAGAMKDTRSPIPKTRMELRAQGKGFLMEFSEMGFSECAWLSTVRLDFAESVTILGNECQKGNRNEVAVYIK
jgi:Tfp pilus assembly protein PilE